MSRGVQRETESPSSLNFTKTNLAGGASRRERWDWAIYSEESSYRHLTLRQYVIILSKL